MKKYLIIALSILLVISLAACDDQPAPDVETVPVTETQTEVATEAQTEVKYLPLEIILEFGQHDVLKYVNHYNENWILTGVTTYLNGKLDNETTYELDPETDQILKLVSTDHDGTVEELEYRYTYNDQGDLIVEDVYSEGIISIRTTFTYDEEGNCLSNKTENISNGTVSIATYDASGNILRNETKMDARGNIPASHTWTEYTYDENGNEVKSVRYHETADNYTTTLTEYDAQGRTVRITITDTCDGVSTQTQTEEYSYKGDKETVTVYDGDGNIQTSVTNIYDDAGNLLSCEAVSGHSTNRTTYTYQKVELPTQ